MVAKKTPPRTPRSVRLEPEDVEGLLVHVTLILERLPAFLEGTDPF